eukprot:GHVO01056294.1.p1 GENE.GHVO01056294.1~~GHVO01056294.1.p1  ORF type:complete len:197 (+),score=28.36 GHVO01056294.1:87-593(+)
MKTNRDVFHPIDPVDKKFEKRICFVDLPGDPRLAFLREGVLSNCNAIIFMIDSTNKLEIKHSAELLYDVLTGDHLHPILILGNKQDEKESRNNDILLNDLERELERYRRSRARVLQNQSTQESYLGIENKSFNLLQDSPCYVKLETCSVLGKEIAPVFDFMQDQFGTE